MIPAIVETAVPPHRRSRQNLASRHAAPRAPPQAPRFRRPQRRPDAPAGNHRPREFLALQLRDAVREFPQFPLELRAPRRRQVYSEPRGDNTLLPEVPQKTRNIRGGEQVRRRVALQRGQPAGIRREFAGVGLLDGPADPLVGAQRRFGERNFPVNFLRGTAGKRRTVMAAPAWCGMMTSMPSTPLSMLMRRNLPRKVETWKLVDLVF